MNREKSARILLIEDNPDHAELIESALKADFQVYWAKSGKSGLAISVEEFIESADKMLYREKRGNPKP